MAIESVEHYSSNDIKLLRSEIENFRNTQMKFVASYSPYWKYPGLPHLFLPLNFRKGEDSWWAINEYFYHSLN